MNLVDATPQAIKEAAAIIQNGGLVAFPTETVYGLGADALNRKACVRIFEAKNRPYLNPLIVHIANISSAEKLCFLDRRAGRLIENFWPGPLTIVMPKTEVVPEIVTAGLPTVAIRMPAHLTALEFIKEARTPIAAPSANPFGYLSPTTAEHVWEQLGEKVDLILDGGECSVGVESTIIDLAEPRPVILREGGLPVEEIEKIIGKVSTGTANLLRPRSPGQLPCHYSPRTPVRILEGKGFKVPEKEKAGLLAFKPPKGHLPYEMIEVLSFHGDMQEAAASLFSCLHRLDRAGLDVIYAEPVPEIGLGRAVMDRLSKACGMERRLK